MLIESQVREARVNVLKTLGFNKVASGHIKDLAVIIVSYTHHTTYRLLWVTY